MAEGGGLFRGWGTQEKHVAAVQVSSSVATLPWLPSFLSTIPQSKHSAAGVLNAAMGIGRLGSPKRKSYLFVQTGFRMKGLELVFPLANLSPCARHRDQLWVGKVSHQI